MKTTIKFIITGFAVAILPGFALTANAAPGDIFVSDGARAIIEKIAPDGTTIGLFAHAPDVGGITGLAFDSGGTLFASDITYNCIRKFNPDGTQSIFAGGLDNPEGLAFDSAGNLFEANFSIGTIYKFAPDGTQTTFATGLNEPFGLACDSARNLFVADYGSGNIYKFAPDGTRSTFASGLAPEGLAFDSAGNLFEVDDSAVSIYKFAPDGTRTPFASGLVSPVALAFDDAGNLLAEEHYSGNVYKFAPDGTPSFFASLGSGFWYFIAVQPPPRPPYVAQIQQPINADGSSVFNVRRGVVPVKFALLFNGNSTCSLPSATIVVTRTAGGTIGAIDESVYVGSADAGSNFRIDNCQYVYNLSASALGVGTYRVDVLINGQGVGSGTFRLR